MLRKVFSLIYLSKVDYLIFLLYLFCRWYGSRIQMRYLQCYLIIAFKVARYGMPVSLWFVSVWSSGIYWIGWWYGLVFIKACRRISTRQENCTSMNFGLPPIGQRNTSTILTFGMDNIVRLSRGLKTLISDMTMPSVWFGTEELVVDSCVTDYLWATIW